MSSFTTHQTRHLGKLNQLKTLQQQVAFWEKNPNNYKKGCQVFHKYIDCVRSFKDPKSLYNSYVRMASYCESMEDQLLSRELLKEAMSLMIHFNLAEQTHIQKMRRKIDSLRYGF